VLETSRGPVWVLLDRDGRVRSARRLSEAALRVAAAGSRGLLWSEGDGVVYETADAGATYSRVATLPHDALVREGLPAVHCEATACVMGRAFSRLGWGVAPAGLVRGSAGPGAGTVRTASTQPALGTPLTCKAKPVPWTVVPGLAWTIDAHEADRGGTAWAGYAVDLDRSAVSMAVARGRPQPRVDVAPVLPPVLKGEAALVVSSQAEGVAALRYRVDRDPDGTVHAGGALRDVEVAWVNLWESSAAKRVVLADGGVLADDDVHGGRGAQARAVAAVLSVSGKGIYACPHAACAGRDRAVWYLEPGVAPRVAAMPSFPPLSWANRALGVRTDLVLSQGQDVPLGFVDGHGALSRARLEGGTWRFETLGLVPATLAEQGYRTSFSWAFSATSALPAMVVSYVAPGAGGFARLLVFGAREPGVAAISPAPTQLDLGEPPRACTPEQRKEGWRFAAPAQPGTRHPVALDDGDGRKTWLLTGSAVVYGARSGACASMLDAAAAKPDEDKVRVLVDLGDLERSWLFRPAEPRKPGTRWKSLECAWDRGASVPGWIRGEE
jgi:hypothetical protein